MDEGALRILQVVASPSRFRILNLLEKGVDHPEDLARRLELRRQSVDKQLLELYGWGFVDRSAVFPADGRPRIVYRMSDLGLTYIEKAAAISREYREEMLADYKRSLRLLEDDLAAGDLDEEAYRKRRRSLETRYDNFLRDELEG